MVHAQKQEGLQFYIYELNFENWQSSTQVVGGDQRDKLDMEDSQLLTIPVAS